MCVTKLDQPFANSKLMNALGIMYPQFYMQLDVDYAFSFHFAIIKKHYCEIKEVRPSLLHVKKYYKCQYKLDLQASTFKLTMKSQAPKVMSEPCDNNLVIKM
jgi:hypothetical protein